jgi:hypothetical protein
MKLFTLLFSLLVITMTSCSDDSDQFTGTWQAVDDPSKQLVVTRSGKSFTIETSNLTSSLDGTTGVYNPETNALEFSDGNGNTTTLAYNDSTRHIMGLDVEFVKAGDIAAVTKSVPDQPAETATSNSTPSEDTGVATTPSNCDKGEILVITGNNVRVRNEPDITKQNILMQVHKNYEVVRLGDKMVDGQKWYRICYDGNLGWVSGQYAKKK